MEIWRGIEGYESTYEVSNLGNVKSLRAGKTLKPCPDKDGYLQCTLCVGGILRTKKIHRLVAGAFLKKIADKDIVNHKDGNKQNNISENLEWCDRFHNAKHAYDNGLCPAPPKLTGILHWSSKLNPEKVRKIRSLYATGNYKQIDLAKEFGINQPSISALILRQTWKNV